VGIGLLATESGSSMFIWLVSFAVLVLSHSQAFEVHGHRGARARYPENTIPAFEHALKVGANALELDLGVTKDKFLVLSHDPHINPELCLDQSGQKVQKAPLISALTLNEVKTYDCGSLKNPKFPKQVAVPATRIPTLEEVLTWLDGQNLKQAKLIKLNIETKSFPENPEYTVPPEEFARLLVGTLKKRGYLDRTVIQSFDYRTLKAARLLEPRVQIAALTENIHEDLVKTALDLKADFISPRWTLVKFKSVKDLHEKGVKVLPWTVNDKETWSILINMKVDGIITDDPEELLKYLKPR
jgi:glycerophosphoryl diester phosphodiesterase